MNGSIVKELRVRDNVKVDNASRSWGKLKNAMKTDYEFVLFA